ncbi:MULTISPECIES: SUMF1/EgtB/PvdO family nonheme iron enzyme [Dysgonomonas]|uniref:type IX secretion system lipoprotein PorK/GldK n=1 Tax=Dysgonomonas TaxID=156973 RepID=UPI00092B7098|nr:MULTISPECIES: SUMF1/EgtB/PvdO family nonheme iron enzyme [Dysgonomonas]MBN9302156.1 SUMF1/EgtB/PvdO family nonheme iron enzyme [Dysgonomonas mossii]MBS5980007.1 SUMF1/EgtB/PvdO family nonheme iron enzyme [Dysgonomonas mossii]OJX61740.1 MAG: gliding motility-associated lipoprotein GldK [Dysgonomonas sp. 37-18]
MKHLCFAIITSLILFTSCGKSVGSSIGGEVVGEKGSSWAEPTPYGMVLVSRGSIEMGPAENDSLWDIKANPKGVSVDNFWMDETEVTNSKYRQFVYWVRDSIIRERLADPAYGGNEAFKITEDRYGDPVKPYLDWRRPIPKRPLEEEELAINSVTFIHPITGVRGLDPRQMNFKYEWFDYTEAAKRRNRLIPQERTLNTDIAIDVNQVVMISKDTAYINEEGRPVNQTIVRPLSSLFDFVHTKIVNVYPDTTVWVNDFNNAYNEPYMRMYFSHSGYNDYPVVGVTWEQATAFCEWRTMFYKMGQPKNGRPIENFRLPTEGEWEFAARNGKTENKYPWDKEGTMDEKACFMANFKPGEGNYTKDGNLIPARVASYVPNRFGIYDLAGNVSEWTSTAYTESGTAMMNDMNPQYKYDAAKEDPYAIKKKVVKGGSWKDIGRNIRGDMREGEFQNQPRSYIGFRCVRTQVGFAKSKK